MASLQTVNSVAVKRVVIRDETPTAARIARESVAEQGITEVMDGGDDESSTTGGWRLEAGAREIRLDSHSCLQPLASSPQPFLSSQVIKQRKLRDTGIGHLRRL